MSKYGMRDVTKKKYTRYINEIYELSKERITSFEEIKAIINGATRIIESLVFKGYLHKPNIGLYKWDGSKPTQREINDILKYVTQLNRDCDNIRGMSEEEIEEYIKNGADLLEEKRYRYKAGVRKRTVDTCFNTLKKIYEVSKDEPVKTGVVNSCIKRSNKARLRQMIAKEGHLKRLNKSLYIWNGSEPTMEMAKKVSDSVYELNKEYAENTEKNRVVFEVRKLTGEKIDTIEESLEKKPPIGLKPKKIHDQERVLDILDAVRRYIYEDIVPPKEWAEELVEYCS